MQIRPPIFVIVLLAMAATVAQAAVTRDGVGASEFITVAGIIAVPCRVSRNPRHPWPAPPPCAGSLSPIGLGKRGCRPSRAPVRLCGAAHGSERAEVALENGADLGWVSRQVGHSSAMVTDQRCGHWSKAARKREVAKLEGALGAVIALPPGSASMQR